MPPSMPADWLSRDLRFLPPQANVRRESTNLCRTTGFQPVGPRNTLATDWKSDVR